MSNTVQTGTPPDVQTDIGVITKGKGSKVRIRLNTFKGKNYVDIRIFLGDSIPTTKGVSLPVAKIGELIGLLEKAEDEVGKSGLA